MLLLTLAACAKDDSPAPQQITMATQPKNEETKATEAAPAETEAAAAPVADGIFSFDFEGTALVPGAAFDAAAMPKEAASVYTVPSCAIEGTDNVYNYEAFEVTAFDAGKGETIYSIYILDPNVTTDEGIALGDSASKVTETYGEDCVRDGNAMTYTRSNTQLIVIAENDSVVSIEYRLIY